MQSELDLLRQENAKLVARITELEQTAKEKYELEIRIAELEHAMEESVRREAENVELKAKVMKLSHDFEELKQQTQVITNMQEMSSIGRASTTENISPNSSPNEDLSNERSLHNKQSSTNDIDSESLEQTQNTVSSEINSDNTPKQMENRSDNMSNSDVCQKSIAQCSTSSIHTETKFNEDSTSRTQEVLLTSQDTPSIESEQKPINQDISEAPINQAPGTISSEIKIPYNQKVEQ
ncbi:14505_t:CDS:2, partial [Entrophospora sp. SA101]